LFPHPKKIFDYSKKKNNGGESVGVAGDGLMVGWGWFSGGILFVLARSDSDGFLEERIRGNVKIRKKNRNR